MLFHQAKVTSQFKSNMSNAQDPFLLTGKNISRLLVNTHPTNNFRNCYWIYIYIFNNIYIYVLIMCICIYIYTHSLCLFIHVYVLWILWYPHPSPISLSAALFVRYVMPENLRDRPFWDCTSFPRLSCVIFSRQCGREWPGWWGSEALDVVWLFVVLNIFV